jgi:acyl-CoA thioesterase-2
VRVGDLAKDTAVTRVGEGRYTATLSAAWEIWGPMGGYIASVALRAAGAESPFARPASYFCQYLGVASFDAPVDITVTTLRSARTALAQRVEITQGDRRMLEATVWSVGDVEGLEHDQAPMPDVDGPDGLPEIRELLTEEELAQGPSFPFWHNLDTKPLAFSREPRADGSPAVWQEWERFTPTATFDDPWVDACRSLVLIDVQSWPAASRAHAWGHGYYAPSLDLYVSFVDPQPASAWLLSDGAGPVARDGLMTWTGRLWSDGGRLVAAGGGQLLCRRMPG